MFWAMRKVNESKLGDVSSRKGNDDLKQAILKLCELGFGFKSLFDERNEEWVEEGDVVLEDFNALVSSHHNRMVAEQLFLHHSTVYIIE